MRRIALSGKVGRGKFARVDDQDYERVISVSSKWWLLRWGNLEYAKTKVLVDRDRKKIQMTILMHRIILGSLDGQTTHHHNDNGLDNRRANLCICSVAENARRQRKREGCSSRFRGVWWDKNRKKWLVGIKLDGQQKWLGRFTSETEAALAYNVAAQELFGRFARLNDV